jgi:threonine/homoserine/homoserine lactone efflux protein
MSLTILAVFAAALFVNAGTPGPSIAALVARVLSSGWKSVLPFLVAMWIGEAIWLGAAVFGLNAIAERFYWGFVVIKYLGCAYLLYLAYRMWTAPAEIKEGELPKGRPGLAMFMSGMAITLGNPKLMVFYLALLPSLVDLARISLTGWAELTLTMMLVLMTTDLAWVALAARAKRWLRSPRAVRAANRTSATAMGGAAVLIATR